MPIFRIGKLEIFLNLFKHFEHFIQKYSEKAQPTDKNELDQPRSRVLHLEEGISYEEKVRKVLDLARLDDHLLAPVDLNFTKMRIVKLNNLKWSNHEVPPEKMKLANTGNGGIT